MGTSPEDVFRRMNVRWANHRLSCDASGPLVDIRDLFRSENLVQLAESCAGRPIEGANAKPGSQNEHDRNVEAVVTHLATKTELEWGAR